MIPSHQNQDSPVKVFSIGDENITVEAMVPSARAGLYAYGAFNAAAIVKVVSFEDKNAQLILHDGTSIPVAMDARELQQKISTADFKAGNRLDLTSVTGAAVEITWPENMTPGQKAADGSIYLGFHHDLDWYATARENLYGLKDHLSLKFKEAAAFAKGLDAHGHSDWQIPNLPLLKKMERLKNKGSFYGTFSSKEDQYRANAYWSSDFYGERYMKCVSFSDSAEVVQSSDNKHFLRCVRAVPRTPA